MKLECGPLRPQKLVPHSPKLRAKMLLTYMKKTSEISKDINELVLHLKATLDKRQLQCGTKVLGMKMTSMDIVFSVLNLVISLWIVDPMEEVLEVLMTRLDVGLVTILDMLLQISTP